MQKKNCILCGCALFGLFTYSNSICEKCFLKSYEDYNEHKHVPHSGQTIDLGNDYVYGIMDTSGTVSFRMLDNRWFDDWFNNYQR